MLKIVIIVIVAYAIGAMYPGAYNKVAGML